MVSRSMPSPSIPPRPHPLCRDRPGNVQERRRRHELEPITNGLSALPTYALAVSPANPALLYAGTIEFPVTNTSDAFLTKLDATTGSILISTVLSGNDTNQGWAVAVDGAGNSYVVGVTSFHQLPDRRHRGLSSARPTAALRRLRDRHQCRRFRLPLLRLSGRLQRMISATASPWTRLATPMSWARPLRPTSRSSARSRPTWPAVPMPLSRRFSRE